MSNDKQFLKNSELILLALDGQLSDEQFSDFDRQLQEDSSFRQYYLRFMALNTSLGAIDKFPAVREDAEGNPFLNQDLWLELAQEEKAALAIEIEKPTEKSGEEQIIKTVRQKRQISRFSIYTLTLSAAAILLLIAVVLFTPVRPIVGTLTDSINAEWINHEQIPARWDVVRQGEMTLSKGFAEITLDNGVKVVLQAPAEIELKTVDLLKLNSGRVYAKVPKGAEGFTVQTNSASIVDFGTEFGVSIDKFGRTETHVFRGEVELSVMSETATGTNGTRLKAGQASVVEGKDIVKIPLQRSSFASYVPTAYEIAVKKKQPISYWRIRHGAAQSLSNLVDESIVTVKYEGVADLVEGPFPGHSDVCSAVKFNGDDSYMFIPLVGERWPENKGPREIKYTFMLWVRPDTVGNQIISVRSNDSGHFLRAVGITEDGHFNYVYWSKRKSKALFTLETDTVAQAGQWYHLAVTIDKKGNAQLFVNGIADG
ncbi:MAG: FecR domain-containing protein, partial [Anaerohalosphaera sp.]|nr:FecR domain-containing protein [Anaerohalosphaera sp.]